MPSAASGNRVPSVSTADRNAGPVPGPGTEVGDARAGPRPASGRASISAIVTQVRRLRTSLTSSTRIMRSRTPNRSALSVVAASTTSSRVRRSAPSLVTRTPARTSRALSAAGSGSRTSSRCASYSSTTPSSRLRTCVDVRGVHLDPAGGPPELVELGLQDQPAPVEDADPGAHLLDLGEQVAGEEDGGAGPVEVEQQLADLLDALRVEAVGRLVEHQQPRLPQQRRRPGRAAGACRASRPGPAGRPPPASPTRSSASATRPRRSTRVAARPHRVEEREVAAPGEVGVRRRPLDQRPDLRQHPPRGPAASARRAPPSAPRWPAPARAASGPSWSCRSRWRPGTRRRRPRARRGRPRRRR